MLKILCVDDESAILDMLATFLRQENFVVIKALNGKTALKFIKTEKPDLVLLDWMLPDIPGLEILKKIRSGKNSKLPVIMLTAKSEEEYLIKGLDTGADDYLKKPFSLNELKARVDALLRRSRKEKPHKFVWDRLSLNPNSRKVKINGNKIKLNRIEFDLLQYFLQNPDRVYSRNQLLDLIWDNEPELYERTVDVHISRLRKALKPHGYANLIKSIRGVGYILSADKAK